MSGDMKRRFILQNECTLMHYTRYVQRQCDAFSCGDKDLDEFFEEDVFLYENEMPGKTYCWVTTGSVSQNQYNYLWVGGLASPKLKQVPAS